MTSATPQQTARHIDFTGPALVVWVSDGTPNPTPMLALSGPDAYRLGPLPVVHGSWPDQRNGSWLPMWQLLAHGDAHPAPSGFLTTGGKEVSMPHVGSRTSIDRSTKC